MRRKRMVACNVDRQVDQVIEWNSRGRTEVAVLRKFLTNAVQVLVHATEIYATERYLVDG